MKKFIKRASIALLALLGLVIAAGLCLCAAVFVNSQRDKRIFAAEQEERIAALEEAYRQPDYPLETEAAMTGFDIDAALGEGIRLNEIRFIGTHNSYKAYNPAAEKLMERLIAPLGLAGSGVWSYGFEPLSQQFSRGIRSLELDVMREKDGLRCAHIPVVDYASTCPDFGLALREIALWSDRHPGHLPITVLVEAKTTILSGGKLFHNFNLDDVLYLEEIVAERLGERLYTPAEMLGAYENFAQLRAADDYPVLSELLGKILVIYHYDRRTTEAYAAHDPTLRSQKMFISSLQWYDGDGEDWWPDSDVNQDYACFGIDNWSGSPILEENARLHSMLMRTRTDSYPWRADEWEAEAMATGAFILSTDFPPRDIPGEDPHVTAFDGGATVSRR